MICRWHNQRRLAGLQSKIMVFAGGSACPLSSVGPQIQRVTPTISWSAESHNQFHGLISGKACYNSQSACSICYLQLYQILRAKSPNKKPCKHNMFRILCIFPTIIPNPKPLPALGIHIARKRLHSNSVRALVLPSAGMNRICFVDPKQESSHGAGGPVPSLHREFAT